VRERCRASRVVLGSRAPALVERAGAITPRACATWEASAVDGGLSRGAVWDAGGVGWRAGTEGSGFGSSFRRVRRAGVGAWHGLAGGGAA